MTPKVGIKHRRANTWKFKDEANCAYIERVDKLTIEGEPLKNEAKVMGIVGGLRMNTKL